ncbi:2-succinyl-5-enolpyruvyl-6-hydroxy-3-cyclohexene- 1-carboxylic-acid synthase [Gangjinia marincola]|uniref:2-succinyl-5-enolpyruvyl-6-hydroxy-3-cyclohexene-1-carboxylate synthase n=1 Tax=Gangjinia marincola TaxID=578463 RepID=A0ABP3XRB4_9FLAO
MSTPIFSSVPLAQSIVALCVKHGIKHVVISPGSRNAPLTIGFANHPKITAYSIVDERCAAFFALGMAQQMREPTAIVCTSGSAVLNYYPAVAEAFYSDIPLVVISADRPEYLIDIGDGQTIRQNEVLDQHVLYSAVLKSDIRDEDKIHVLKPLPAFVTEENSKDLAQEIIAGNEKEINTALSTARDKRGPVHLNAPFNEPLYNTTTVEVVPALFDQTNKVKQNEENPKIADLLIKIKNANRIMVLIGVLHPNEIEQDFIELLAKDQRVVVLTETTANIHHPNFFPGIDTLIAPIEKNEQAQMLYERLQPDILITFGGMIVSKKIKVFLRNYQPKTHIHVDPKHAMDTFFCLRHFMQITPNEFFEKISSAFGSSSSTYRPFWDEVKTHRIAKRDAYRAQAPYSDFTVYPVLFEHIPRPQIIQLSNSSTIRYSQLFDLHPDHIIYCNRGTSGIDGSTSTAIGHSLHAKEPTTLITGDLSFFYDSNALWIDHLRDDLRIIVINNSGGGIFRILPGDTSADYFEKYFETTHELNAAFLCTMYNLAYAKAETLEQLKNQLTSFYSSSNRPKLLEICTPKAINDEVLLDHFDFMRKDF